MGGGVGGVGNAGSKMSGGDSVPGSKTLLGSLGLNMSGGDCSPKKSGGSPKKSGGSPKKSGGSPNMAAPKASIGTVYITTTTSGSAAFGGKSSMEVYSG